MSQYRTRKVKAEDTVSYQYGRYEMKGSVGKRRSVFKVEVHLGEHETPEAALTAWTKQIKELEKTRPNQANKLQEKLDKLRELTPG